MSIERRIQICQLVEKINKDQEYSKKLGLTNESTFHGNKQKIGGNLL